ncbi:uncharacterized protein LOC111302008 [Durio zibethinus]|uniref:Uncharacterized protein LOC111302008 n=1 Tax=Durio zibethinus TaxID=66656 RepID=A0A6P5ZMB4_DURZI|nr:uncharacterized protein LOC111302008 [Durio zibethinus]
MAIRVLINRDSQGHSYFIVKFLTINDAKQGSMDATFRTPLTAYKKLKSLGFSIAWPFLVSGAICLFNSINERDLSLLTSYVKHESHQGIKMKKSVSAIIISSYCMHGWHRDSFCHEKLKQLSTMDISTLASMKNIVKYDTWCEIQNPMSHRVFECKFHPKPLGQGPDCLGVMHHHPL